MNFEQWLLSIGRSEGSSKKYSRAISNSINEWAKEANLINENIIEMDYLDSIVLLFEKIKKLDKFVKRDSTGNGMYSAALKHYTNYIDDISGHSIDRDISSIISEKILPETEKVLLISARVGQGQFRKKLISYWQGCTLTNFTNTRFLVASHIKPWKKSSNEERLDVDNGLLLLPNYDKAFDLGYITFSNEGMIIISKYLENLKVLGIHEDQSFKIKEGNLPYMKFHRENVFESFQ